MSAKRPVENSEYFDMLHRMIAGAGRRTADGDPSDLARLVALRNHLDMQIQLAVDGMRENQGFSWAEIAAPLGITRQGAAKNWGHGANV